MGKAVLLVRAQYLCTLMYADNIVILEDSEEALQALLQIVNRRCEKWQMVLNQSKTNVAHFWPASKLVTHFNFKCGSVDMDIVSKYKYLGLWFTEHYDLTVMTAKALSVSASRALGVLISKYKATNVYWLFSWFDFHSISCSIILFWMKNYLYGKIFSFGFWQF